jgi:hypothetical protein
VIRDFVVCRFGGWFAVRCWGSRRSEALQELVVLHGSGLSAWEGGNGFSRVIIRLSGAVSGRALVTLLTRITGCSQCYTNELE